MEPDLFSFAEHYHSLSARVLPLDRDGSPCVQKWQKWKRKKQTPDELSSLPWEKATGLAFVLPGGCYRCLQITGGGTNGDLTLNRLCAALELPTGYPWRVHRASGPEIWVRSKGMSTLAMKAEARDVEATEIAASEVPITIHWSGGYRPVPSGPSSGAGPMEFQGSVPDSSPLMTSLSKIGAALEDLSSSPASPASDAAGPGDTEGNTQPESSSPEAEQAANGSKASHSPEGHDTPQDDSSSQPEGPSPPDSHDPEGNGPDRQALSRQADDGRDSSASAFSPDSTADTEASEEFPAPTPATEVEMRSIDWLWEGYIARGMLHMLNGDPGHGKSTLLLTLAARFSKEQTPDGGAIDPVSTLYLSAEDQAGVTLVPRYKAAVGDAERLHVVDAADAMDLSLPAHTEELEAVIRSQGIQFCVVDPLFSFLDRDHEKNSEQDIRAVLSELTNVAEATGCAFVLVRHFNKKESLSAVYRGGGSIGITAQARLGFALAPHPDRPEQDRVLAWTKNNLSDKSLREALVFRQDTHPVPGVGEQPTFQFQGTEQWTADELLSAEQRSRGRPPKQLQKAKAFLQDEIKDGKVRSTELINMTEDEDFSTSTLRRAKEVMGIQADREQGAWWWHFPDSSSHDKSSSHGPKE